MIDPSIADHLKYRNVDTEALKALNPSVIVDPESVDEPIPNTLLAFYRALPEPLSSEIDVLKHPELIPCMGHLSIVDILENDYRYRLFGSAIARILTYDMTGKLMSDAPPMVSRNFLMALNDFIRDTGRTTYSYVTAAPGTRTNGWWRLSVPLYMAGTCHRILSAVVNDGVRLDVAAQGSPSL